MGRLLSAARELAPTQFTNYVLARTFHPALASADLGNKTEGRYHAAKADLCYNPRQSEARSQALAQGSARKRTGSARAICARVSEAYGNGRAAGCAICTGA